MQIPKEIDQVLTEEVLEELPGSRGFRFIEARPDIDSCWITIYLKNRQNEYAVLRILPNGSLAGHKAAIRQALIEYDPSVLEELKPKETIQPARYTGEVSLRMGNAPHRIGARIQMGNRPDFYEVTRIEPNGLCFGVHVELSSKVSLGLSSVDLR